eukprot:2367987-Pyramimonas_sp.AAC.1
MVVDGGGAMFLARNASGRASAGRACTRLTSAAAEAQGEGRGWIRGGNVGGRERHIQMEDW